jgi:hypothetical protein
MTDFDTVCEQNRSRIQELPVRDQYQQTIIYCGRTYCYDPDFDCFYPQDAEVTETLWDRYGWIVVIVALTALSIITA